MAVTMTMEQSMDNIIFGPPPGGVYSESLSEGEDEEFFIGSRRASEARLL